ITAHPDVNGDELRKLITDLTSDQLTVRTSHLHSGGYIEVERVRGKRAAIYRATGKRPATRPDAKPPVELGPVVPPRQPDTWKSWAEPYLQRPAGRRDAFDFRAVPSLRNGRRHFSQER
ncbi:MAG: hypothetical protein AB7O64_15310, partial [Methylibium sp.]